MQLKKAKSNLPINTAVFEAFKSITIDDTNVRLKGAVGLIKIIQDTEDEKFDKTLDYALKRLIRGCGSSNQSSRIGFHTALAGLLNSDMDNPPGITEMIEIIKKEFLGNDDKGKVDALVGTTLACGCIIRSGKAFGRINEEEIAELTKCLVACVSKPSVAPLAFNFLNDLVSKAKTDTVKSSIWPEVKKSLSTAKDKITIDQLYLLLSIEDNHNNVIDEIFYKKYWQTKSILDSNNFDIFIQLLWHNKNTNAINHPFYIYFMKKIVDAKLLKSFWEKIDKIIENPTKQLEQVTIHTAICALKCSEGSKDVKKILTENFLKLLNLHSAKSIKDEDVQEMYTELLGLLDQKFQILKKEEQKLEILKVFIVSPGRLTIEKGSSKKFISNLINILELESLKEVIEDIKMIIISDKDERERQYAASILQKIISTNKLVSNNIEWRIQQLNFLVYLAFFKSKDGKSLSTNEVDINSNSNNIKNIFYHCLEYKLSNLEDEKKFLMGIIHEIDGVLTKKDFNKYLQKPLNDNHMKAWKLMIKEVTTKFDKKEKKLRTVFQVLILHMGLQLFNHPDVAENAINELEPVTKRALQKNSDRGEGNQEPDWIEVVVDLFLTLLSQESYVLRNVIRHVFPQLCSQMNISAFHQILSLLDIKSKENPLQVNGNHDSDDESENGDKDSDSENEDDQESSEDEDVENGKLEEETSENEEDSDIEMEEDDDNAEFEEKETVNDSLRLAVQTALGTAAADGDDIDLDDMNEEEGMKLDMALANAFKILKQNRKQKKTKADKIAEKTLLHFRMRALDLIDIYLKNNPQMEICLETLIFFFDLMPIAIREDKHTPLLPRFDGIFLQLSQLKSFSLETVSNVTPKHLAETLTNILDKTLKEKTNIQHLDHFSRAVIFIINCSQMLLKLTPGDDEVLGIIVQKVQEFLTHRNPTLQLTSFLKIISTQWTGNFKLCKFIADTGLKSTTRSLRRTQSLQMLKTFFKNHSLMTQNEKQAIKYPAKICEALKEYASELNEVPEPEILELIQFILALRNHKDFSVKDELVSSVQKFRSHLQLKPNVLSAYKSFCNVMKIPFVSNDQEKTKIGNGLKKDQPQKTKIEKAENKPNENGGVKRKKTNTKKEKKMRKRMQLEIASKGFDENFSFTTASNILLN